MGRTFLAVLVVLAVLLGGPLLSHGQGFSSSSPVVSGTVEMGTSTITSLVSNIAEPVCTMGGTPEDYALTTAETNVPPTALSGRTRWTGINTSTALVEIWCCLGAGCTPTSTVRFFINSAKGDGITIPARDGDVIRCRCATGNCTLNVLEESCAQVLP